MRKPNLKIVADSDLPFVREYFEKEGELVLKQGRALERADLLDADLLLVRSITRVDENLLRGTRVRFVGTVTTGVDHLDTEWLDRAGILWRSAAGYNAIPVADYVLASIAALQEQGRLPTERLRVGVVGVGQIGGRVAERCRRLGFEVLLCDPPRAQQEKDFVSRSLAELSGVDFLSLHTPLTRTGQAPTHHLVNAAVFERARRPCVLLNTSRGAVVDFSSLKKSGKNWTYGLDVWEGEPEIDFEVLDSAAIATPHLAGYSVQCRYRGIELIYRACRELKLIDSEPTPPLPPPSLQLSFQGRSLNWQQVLLAIFDPLSASRTMKETLNAQTVLLKGAGKCATLFDELRQAYIGDDIQRHEFGFTTVSQLHLEEKDREALTQLGITIKE